jgi:hypothetical protein
MALSDNVIRDGDQGFLGFASRLNPTTLPAGMLQGEREHAARPGCGSDAQGEPAVD